MRSAMAVACRADLSSVMAPVPFSSIVTPMVLLASAARTQTPRRDAHGERVHFGHDAVFFGSDLVGVGGHGQRGARISALRGDHALPGVHGAAVLEGHAEGDERHAALLSGLTQPLDLAAVREELAGAVWVVVGVAAVRIGRDVAADQPQLAVVDANDFATDYEVLS